MRRLSVGVTALAMALAWGAFHPPAARAEVDGFHVNITPYAGIVSWADQTNAENKALFGGRLGLMFGKRFGIEGSYGRSNAETLEDGGGRPYVTTSPSPVQDMTFSHWAGDLVFNILPDSKINPYLQGGYSSHKFDPEDSTANESTADGFNVAAGLKIHFSPKVALRLEARDMIYSWSDEEQDLGASDESQHSLAFTGGLQFSIGGKVPDADTDGVSDKSDECPNTPTGALVDLRGCPLDADGDKVPDGLDKCANTPTGATVNAEGCPTDADGDGVYDGIDTCADTPKGCTVDAKGCQTDSDQDKVCDGLDQCASTPVGATVDANGCTTDSDADGVVDGLDKCAATPAGAKVDKDGCPIEVTRRVMEMLDKGVITERELLFDTAKATIKPESEATLQALCQVFQQWPTIQVEIGGHTDARGSNAYNQNLSEQRANAVRDYLAANCTGANAANFTAKGYGESMPVAKGATAEAYAQNRRVEFKVMNPEELRRLKESREILKEGTPSE
ncbi:MAG TPA: OmpA family protein [Candidatus Eisenbacteria bacterium]|nr:OmpA family protein [Candidatus Eisenbacteria bacterium]